jgi:hypothetical protein
LGKLDIIFLLFILPPFYLIGGYFFSFFLSFNTSAPEQMETWSDLMPALTWQLWLARDAVEDAPLLWQKN